MSDEEADGDLAQQAPPKRRKKKRRKVAAETEEAALRPGVPLFASGFPRDPELDRLVDAFERGNYAAVREGASRLAKDAQSADVRRAAGELLRRIDPDRLAVTMLVAAVGLLVFLSIWYWSHAHVAP